MKILKTVACLLCLFCYIHSSAQKDIPLNEPDRRKPNLFSDLPSKLTLNIKALDVLLDMSIGTYISAPLAGSVIFEGIIISKSDPNDGNTKSVVIKSTNRMGAVLTFTRNRLPDGGTKYIGRILSRNNSDAFEIGQEEGQYVLVKKQLYDIISE